MDLVEVTASTGADTWGLFVGGSLVCERYAGGTWIDGSQRATIAFSGGQDVDGQVTMVPVDGGETVGDGSFVFKSGTGAPATAIHVWDVQGEVVYTRTLATDTLATTPLYRDGYLWWLEWNGDFNNPTTVSLMRSRCDLGDVTELETFDLPEVNGNVGGAHVHYIVPLDGGLDFSWLTNNESGHQQLRFFNKSYAAGVAADKTNDYAAHYDIPFNVDGATDWLDGSASCVSIYHDGQAYLAPLLSSNHEDGIGPSSIDGALQYQDSTTPGVIWANNDGDWLVSSTSISVFDGVAALYGNGTIIRHDATIPVDPGGPALVASVDGPIELGLPVAMFYVGPSA